ncbi:T9SS type A sorting domain-containing protein [Ilyomonas limi]|uniref:non-specific serine/threonine protein kinase n=1 Tax=Ilyomonas limi TaxID=2575867 RepID=A0A4U3KVR9_9BACT|nr:T9SS type A sorting domain-containing protein [Ilyomonas limi]TKK65694.1 T9SS type A sorting domain-containing protein [Ilyomonas limi]
MKRNSMLFCLVFFITANLFTTAKAQVNVNDSLALVDLYNSTDGPNWRSNTNWLTTAPVSTWADVQVVDNRVTVLYLSYNNLNGIIPASIGNLTQLDGLYIEYCELHGAIPAEIGNLTQLTNLWLEGNQLSGAIPAEIGNCTKLEVLYIPENQLSGSIPASIGNLVNLTSLDIDYNQLSGTIPSSIGNLVNLHELVLNDNQLSGTIPASIGNLVNVWYLYLYNNQLSGAIPTSIGNCTNLHYLMLYNNQLSGVIPAEMGRLKYLNQLILNNNQLSGAIPAEIGNLDVYLVNLDLHNNQLSGAIPAEIGNLVNLGNLDLHNNQLSGAIPASLRRLNLYNLDLSYNQLSQDRNVHFSIDISRTEGSISNNLFTFNGMEFIANRFPRVTYTPQAILPLHQNGNTLSVYAGGTLSNNTYNWHLAGTTDSTIIKADSTFTPQQSGKYYVTVKNKVATKLILHSDTIDFTLSPLKSNNTLIAKGVQSGTVIQHMQVYPNPAKEVVHVQIKGNAMIAIANAAGKVLLTKTINNSDAINVSSLAPGIYYLQNKASGETQKIVVVH